MRRLLLLLPLLVACPQPEPEPREQWSEAEAEAWQDATPWLVGVNFAPSTASNQFEMWQDATWDPDTIDAELGMAADLGFNTVRVFVHDQLWDADSEAYLARIDAFLALADGHGIGTMLVLFDGVWDPEPAIGPQAEPIPGVHNSRWVQGPGAAVLGDLDAHAGLQGYVQGVVAAFGQDERVVVWDLFNEANNPNLTSYGDTELDQDLKNERALQLMSSSRSWALELGPVQPITSGAFLGQWEDADNLSALNAFMFTQMDVVSFHSYSGPGIVDEQLRDLRQYGRPLLCTEFMARPESTFEEILPLFDQFGVHAWSWGLVDGRSQTKFPWSSWDEPVLVEPDPWHHDVLHPDGTPYDDAEADFLRGLL